MSNEELVAKIQAGETTLLHQLWTQVEKFISMQAGKRARQLDGFGGVTSDDLYNSGFLALVEAVKSFDPEEGGSFVSWLALHLKTAFAEAGGYRYSKQACDPLHNAGSIYEPISNDTEKLFISDVVPDPCAAQAFEDAEQRIWNEQLHDALVRALSRLPESERTVVESKYYCGRSFREIGPRAQQLKDRAFTKLRRMHALQRFVEPRTPYYSHVGLRGFNTTHTSSVEWAVLKREKLTAQI